MDKIVLKFENKGYSRVDPLERNSLGSDIVSTFLQCDAYNSLDYYIKLLQNPEFKYGMGNLTTLYKPGDGTITLTIYPYENMDPEPEFKTTVDNLIKIIKDWDWIHKQKFPKVLMTVDGDKVTFEPIEDDAPVDHEQK